MVITFAILGVISIYSKWCNPEIPTNPFIKWCLYKLIALSSIIELSVEKIYKILIRIERFRAMLGKIGEWFVFCYFYTDLLYLICSILPRLIAGILFVIDICIYNHLYYFILSFGY